MVNTNSHDEDALLTPEDFEETMLFISANFGDDKERVHKYMDSLMEDTLIALGYEKGVEIFKRTPKWYA